MARYTRGKHAVLMDDIFGRKIKYKDAPKNVLERAEKEIKKLDCPEE